MGAYATTIDTQQAGCSRHCVPRLAKRWHFDVGTLTQRRRRRLYDEYSGRERRGITRDLINSLLLSQTPTACHLKSRISKRSREGERRMRRRNRPCQITDVSRRGEERKKCTPISLEVGKGGAAGGDEVSLLNLDQTRHVSVDRLYRGTPLYNFHIITCLSSPPHLQS
ncbi:unnamed protein product [Hymenolepis diminuta]|uniref:Uncharacterized protein n=1 Tax=Hymenolepis diminuta TaxID=6216 RepID=A0A564Y6Q2_HYMDI|nr:unnamed protein product [Hymenolepis diminuta]